MLKEKAALEAEMYLCIPTVTPSVKLFKENLMCVTVDLEILQHLNLSIFQGIDFLLSRNLKSDPSPFTLNNLFLSFHLVCYKDNKCHFRPFYG